MLNFQLNLSTETVDHAHPAEPLCVAPEMLLRDLLKQLQQRNRGQALVCRDGRLVGIFTERDALRLLASRHDLDVPVEQVMVRDPVSLSKTDTVGQAIARMAQGGYRRLPIVNDQGQPMGVVKTSGILHYLVEHFPGTIYNLPPAPHHAAQQREGA